MLQAGFVFAARLDLEPLAHSVLRGFVPTAVMADSDHPVDPTGGKFVQNPVLRRPADRPVCDGPDCPRSNLRPKGTSA